MRKEKSVHVRLTEREIQILNNMLRNTISSLERSGEMDGETWKELSALSKKLSV